MSLLTQFTGGGLILRQQLITATGTWTRPAKMVGNTVWLTMIGGGGGGSTNQSFAGNGGEYRIDTPVDIGIDTTVACTIGAAGVGGAAGGTTSFGSYLSVVGGSVGGSSTASGAPGGRLSSSLGDIHQGADTPLGYGGRSANSSVAGGGGGLLLGLTPPRLTGSHGPGAQGYGAGGYSSPSFQTGAPGAILVQWPELI